MTIEVKPEADGKFGLYVNGALIGTSKLHCDATLAGEIIKRAVARERESAERSEHDFPRGQGEMGQ